MNTQKMDTAWAKSVLPRRSAGAHKWGVGGLIVVGGAPGYIGAPAMASLAAMRVGAGIVLAAVSRTSIGPIATLAPEAVFLPMPEGDPHTAARKGVELIQKECDRVSAFVVGPGLSQDEHAHALMARLFESNSSSPKAGVGFGVTDRADTSSSDADRIIGGDKPAVVDADGLNWLSLSDSWWEAVKPGSLILTPHPGEMARLTGIDPDEISANPVSVASQWAKKWKQTVLLKANPAVVSDGKSVLVQEDVSPAFATAGTGDVLAGSVGGFLAQGVDPVAASGLALYLGTAAAFTLIPEVGVLGLIASDLPRAIAGEIARLESA